MIWLEQKYRLDSLEARDVGVLLFWKNLGWSYGWWEMFSSSQKRTYHNYWEVSVNKPPIWSRKLSKGINAQLDTDVSVPASGFTHKQWRVVIRYWDTFACDSCWQRNWPVSEAIYWMWWSYITCTIPAQLLSLWKLWIVTKF